MPSASERLALVLLLAAGGAFGQGVAEPGGAQQPRVRLSVQASALAGYRYYAAAEVWASLRVGDRLALVREPDNPFDANAIRIEWRGTMLGYLPRRENATLAAALDRGLPLQARIRQLSEHPNPARRVAIEVLIE